MALLELGTVHRKNGLGRSRDRRPHKLPQVTMMDSPTVQKLVEDLLDANVISPSNGVRFAEILQRAQEKHRQDQSHLGPLSPQQNRILPILQDD